MIPPRPFLRCLPLLVVLAGLSAATHDARAATAPAKPNVVVFLVDDMGVMDTSVPFLTDEAGKAKKYPLNEWYRTPAMERLAARGQAARALYDAEFSAAVVRRQLSAALAALT